jgi:hypothetical protein
LLSVDISSKFGYMLPKAENESVTTRNHGRKTCRAS